MQNLVMYIVINKDLGMSAGKTAAQASHACTEYLINTLCGNNDLEKEKLHQWHNDCQKKIVLGAHENIMQKLSERENVYVVHDLGFTEIAPNSLTAICLGIFDKADVPKEYSKLRLL